MDSKKKKVVAIIPARMTASRFPGKPLARILDLPLIEHVRRRARLSEAVDDVYVATCDEEIFDAVCASGGKAIMTRSTHERCTDRVEEAAYHIDLDIAVIVQGDEPLFQPAALDSLVRPLLDDDAVPCSNLLSVIRNPKDLCDVDIVKTALDESGFIMYFSRSPIPYVRVRNENTFLRQTGLSAFTKKFLHSFAVLRPTALEVTESVDFLRILGHRFPIKGVIYDGVLVGVDRFDDIREVERILKEDPEQNALYESILKI